MRVHLWSARNLTSGRAHPEPGEDDIKVVRLSLPAAVREALNGKVRCAASVALILAVAQRQSLSI